MEKEKLIDVKSLIASKNPKALKRTPKFLIRYLERILHQKEINEFLLKNKDKKNQEWCEAAVNYLNITFEVIGIDKIPKDERIIIVLNHPLGGMDALILVHALKGHRDDLMFIVNDLLMNITSLKEMFVGVNKHGKNKLATRSNIKELFESDKAVCVFPSGMVSRKEKGNIEDLEWKKTFVQYAKECDRTIVPIFIDGKLSNFFYRLSRLRQSIGIKMNIEMLYLANELFKQRDQHIKFVVGDPIDRDFLMRNNNNQQTAQEIKEIVYKLSDKV
ncbi:1-acyl-sn-glycerol-3-phosphate acyltransferase [Crocinitomicaceae bacterium]|nr:1-acyl-sn-glycerol-3-phosphate acyltransferase [Crocinitomicaceae bacterium]